MGIDETIAAAEKLLDDLLSISDMGDLAETEYLICQRLALLKLAKAWDEYFAALAGPSCDIAKPYQRVIAARANVEEILGEHPQDD